MRILPYLLTLTGLFINTDGFTQSGIPSHSFNTATRIFKTFEKNTVFLNTKGREIDSLQSKFEFFYQHYNNTPKDSLFLVQLSRSFNNSLSEFTNFNAREITDIAGRLKGVQPIRGSEISYLNHSYKIFTKYLNLDAFISKKLSKIKKKKNTNIQVRLSILQTRINQLSAFYKNYYPTISHTKIRRILNADDATYQKKDNAFKHLAKNLLSRKNYKLIQKSISHNLEVPSSIQIADTAIYFAIKNQVYRKSRIKKDRKQIKHLFNKDNAYRIGQFFTQQISGAIGNFAGMFQFRKGYLYKNDSLIRILKEKLQPMDILSEKTGFALTDKMIPGHFGHIAIWLGTQKQLEKNNLWNHPLIKPFQNRIQSGYCILETDREGTHLKTLKKFMNVDEIAIARIIGFSDLPLDEKINIYKNALAQLGKKYDFNFDVETSDKLVCSELLYQVFGSVHWPTDRMLKRATISPDNVLSLILYQNTPLELCYYLSAESRKKIRNKNTDDLAKDLGFVKKNSLYKMPDNKCVKKKVNGKKRAKKVCHTIYHELIYE